LKICVVGASGLLGEGFQRTSKNVKNEFIFCYAKNKIPNAVHLDITKEDMVKSFFQIHKPDVLINCSAITDPEFCEKNKSVASNVNTLGAKRLAQACNNYGSYMIHVSTEYIFDGNNGPYHENDTPKPISYYGQTKLESEKVVLKENQNFCVARASLLYGWSKNKQNLATMIISELRNNRQVKLINDLQVSPSYTDNVAEMILELAKLKISGIFNVANSSIITRYDFGMLLTEVFELNKSLIKSISVKDFHWEVPRPHKSGLLVEKISSILRKKPLNVKECLIRMREEEERKEC
jgi:dTDP-4-dehydrorhamnose reductase